MKTLLALSLLATTALAQAPTCTFTNFGRPCAGDLAGQLARSPNGPVVQLDVTNAAPGSLAVMVLGHASASPRPLPGSNCNLLVDPRATMLGRIDRSGATAFRFPLPVRAIPLNVDFQVVTLNVTRRGRSAGSTNGVNLVCR